MTNARATIQIPCTWVKIAISVDSHQPERKRTDRERRAFAVQEREFHDAAGHLHRPDQGADQDGVARAQARGGQQADEMRGHLPTR